MELSYTLIADGPADKALIPILYWVIAANGYTGNVQGEWCDFRLKKPSLRPKLSERILYALSLYPCDLLFIHRDAEGTSREKRGREITKALCEVAKSQKIPTVCVIPVRMTETWLLFDEAAIRRAAGNPSGRQLLNLPRLSDLERLPNPKDMLHRLIRQATGLSVRRQRAFSVGYSVSQITQYIEDFSQLRSLDAFRAMESDICQIMPMILGQLDGEPS